MKNKKMFIIVAIMFVMTTLITAGVTYICVENYYSNHLFGLDGKPIGGGKEELFEAVNGITDEGARRNMIEILISSNTITQKEANKLY